MKAFSVPILSDVKSPIGFDITNKEVYRIIENKVALHYQLLPSQFINTSRKMGICEARQVFQFLMRDKTSYSLTEIGCYTGKIDHSDVVHNVTKIRNLCEIYPEFKRAVDAIMFEVDKEISVLINQKLAS